MAARVGSNVDPKRLLECALRKDAEWEGAVSLAGLRQRIAALQVVLEDLPRHGWRLLRRAAKAMPQAERPAPCPYSLAHNTLCPWRRGDTHIVRPLIKDIGRNPL